MRLILASQSPGRKRLLELLKIPFETIPSTLDEDKVIGKTPLQTIRLRAKMKGEDIVHTVFTPKSPKLLKSLKKKDYMVISADSGAILNNQLIGKPKDYKDAVKIMKTLSGKTHRLVTAVYQIRLIGQISQIWRSIGVSFVTFRPLSDADIAAYLFQPDYTCYAGGYALFNCPACRFPALKELTSDLTYRELLQKNCKDYEKYHKNDFISEIKGSLSNVIGLPLEKLHLSLDNHS